MYYLFTLEDKVRIPANMLDMNVTDAALKLLRETYERRVFKELGLVLSISDVKIKSEGIVVPADHHVYYEVEFNALSFIPHVNEVFEAEVKDIVDFGVFASIGPLNALLHISQISQDKFSFDKKTKSIIGKNKRSIKKGDVLLVKVATLSLKPIAAESKIGLTMRSAGLGKKEWLEEEKTKEIKESKKTDDKSKKEKEKEKKK